MTTVLVNVAGLILIGLIVWWFWLSKPKTQSAASGVIDVIVEGGVYVPARIEVVAGQPVTLRFLRKDPSPCAEKVLFDEIHVHARAAHGMDEVPPEVVDQIQGVITEV